MKLLIANSEIMVLRGLKTHLACKNDIEILGLIVVLMSDATTRQIKASCPNAQVKPQKLLAKLENEEEYLHEKN